MNAYWPFTDIILLYNSFHVNFRKSEVVTSRSFPHNLVLDSQSRFGRMHQNFQTSIIFYGLADFHENCCKSVQLSQVRGLLIKYVDIS